MTHPTVIKLHDGNLMPQLGLGVWKAGNEEVVSAIHKALEVGYRSFDTAAAYQNEAGVGNALQSAGVNRDELFITTKLWNDDQKRPHEALKESLSKLKLDYVDLYLIHWPVPAIGHYVEAWQALIELQQQGLAKSIGVCNFQVPHLQKLIDETGVAPVINQIELHPLLQQRMQLYLVDHRRDAGFINQLLQMRHLEITHADALRQPLLLQLNQRLPGLDVMADSRHRPVD